MNVCKERCVYCELATDLGFCSVTGCRKRNQVSNVAIIPTVTVTDSPMVEYAPIVRCKDCKWFVSYTMENKTYKMCRKAHLGSDDFFCADGERRDPCSSQDS